METLPIERTAAMRQAEASGFADVEGMLKRIPHIGEQKVDTITDNTIAINAQCPNPRMKFVFEKLVRHLHDFAREVNLTTEEFHQACDFLSQAGQISTGNRKEFILLADVLGLELLVDALSNPKPKTCTESTVLGPFHTDHAEDIVEGGSINTDNKGQALLVKGRVTDSQGRGIANAVIDTWETDGDGFYDIQYCGRDKANCRGVIRTNQDGYYSFRGVVPVPYPIQSDGPTGKLLLKLGRHCFRPAHIHFFIDAPGYEHLTTAVYRRGDPFLTSDAVFGVKDSLIVDFVPQEDGKSFVLEQNFVLATVEEVAVLKQQTADHKGLSVNGVNGVNGTTAANGITDADGVTSVNGTNGTA